MRLTYVFIVLFILHLLAVSGKSSDLKPIQRKVVVIENGDVIAWVNGKWVQR
jgi:hypothetical protein